MLHRNILNFEVVSVGIKNEGSHLHRPRGISPLLEVSTTYNLLILIWHFLRKWDGRNFTRGNLVEDSARFKDIYGQRLPNGEHPTIHWNRYYIKKRSL